MQPLPPSPAFTRILASSINMSKRKGPAKAEARLTQKCGGVGQHHSIYLSSLDIRLFLLRFYRLNHHKFAHGALVHEFDAAGDLGKERVVFPPADVQSGLNPRAALAHDDGAARHQLSAESLKSEPLRVGIA